jgi:hypothetical protein
MTTVEQTSQRHELYREVNKRIREAAESFAADQPVAYLCECGLTDCSATVEFTRVQYDALLSQDGCFVLKAEHA